MRAETVGLGVLKRSLENMLSHLLKNLLRIATLSSSVLFLVGCGMYSSDLAAYEPRIHNVRQGSFIDLENSAGGIYVERITNAGIYVSRRNGYEGWKLSEGSNSMGNGEHLRIMDYDVNKKTAIIKQTETDRRGFSGAFSF